MKNKIKNLQSKIYNLRSYKGFTLIELLIVIGITVILAAASIPIYGHLQVAGQLDENTSQMIQAVRTARERSSSRLNNASHGVYFEINAGSKDKYILYQGSSYATRSASYDREVILDDVLSLSTTDFILTGGKDVDINFSKGLAVPDNVGTMTITHNVDGARQFSVNSMGKIEQE